MKNFHLILITLFVSLTVGFVKSAAGNTFAPKIDSIQVVFDTQQLILPGESFHIGIAAYYKNGKVKKTVGIKGGSVWWWNYKVEVSGGTDFGGRILVNKELVPSKGKYIAIKAWPRKQSELEKELLLPLNYETKIKYRPTVAFDKSPGSQVKGELVAEFNNGDKRTYSNLRNSKESANFRFYTKGGSWKNGKFTIDPDFTKIDNHQSSLIVRSLQNRAVTDTFSVLLDYKHAYDLQLSGSSGMLGFSGTNGGSGYPGGNGQNGQNGDFGSDGPDLGVWVDLYRDSLLNCDLLYVYAQNSFTGEEYHYLINPEGGSLTVRSQGGSGGTGGYGGSGGNGASGSDGRKWTETKTEKKIVQKPVTKKVTRKQRKKVTNADGKEVEIEEDVEVDETVMVDVETEVQIAFEVQGPGEDGGDGGHGGAGGLGGEGGYGGNITLYFT
ncbi:MAG: hypothetical protein GZ094_16375, partial [Mariniphaga sp.]|nr:hypothetical protein [Mariniphaga sp.]